MFHALLHRKLKLEGERDAHFERLEDALTATVFERLSYLPPALAVTLLAEAAPGLGGPCPWPQGDVAFDAHFWPWLEAPADVTGRTNVEPDVVIWLGSCWLLVEAKHHGAQDARQWVREVRALQHALDRPHKTLGPRGVKRAPILFLAVGGTNPAGDTQRLEAYRTTLSQRSDEPVPPVARLRWRSLGKAVRRHAPDHPAHHKVLVDISEAVRVFSYAKSRDIWRWPTWHSLSGEALARWQVGAVAASSARLETRVAHAAPQPLDASVLRGWSLT